LPHVKKKALAQVHCHHYAVLDVEAEKRVMGRLGLDYEVMPSGCCGMAGSFGFERDHYDVSMRVGELVLLPAVRRAPPDTLVIADGFSCRTQIAQATGREALHLADVIDLVIRSASTNTHKTDPSSSAPRLRAVAGQRGR
jgi:Fe-S oxidoreductase